MARINLTSVMAYPIFVQNFHLTNLDRGLLNSVFFWSMAAFQIPMGLVVDRFGVKYPYAICLVIWSVACVACGVSMSVFQLAMALLLAGFGEAIVVPANFRWMRNSFEERQMGLAVAVYLAGTKLGPAIGAPVAAWFIVNFDSWQVLYFLLAVGGLLFILPPWLFYCTPDGSAQKSAMEKKENVGRVPLSRIFMNPVVLGTIVVDWAYAYFLYYCMTWTPIYLVENWKLTLTEMGYVQFFSFIGITAVALPSGWIADALIKRGRDPVAVRKGFVMAGFFVALTEVFGFMTASRDLAIFCALFSLSGLGLASANYLALCRMTLIPKECVGLIASVQNIFASLAGVAGAILTGWLLQETGSYSGPMILIAVFLISGIAACFFLLRKKWALSIEVSNQTS
ncbi:MFS transporter [Novosphingobium mathurense]|nr:MFS transporter [Novosphingobium mathurense]